MSNDLELSLEQRTGLEDQLRAAFPRAGDVRSLARQLLHNPEEAITDSHPAAKQLEELMEYAERTSRVSTLVQEARRRNPWHQGLEAWAKAMGLPDITPIEYCAYWLRRYAYLGGMAVLAAVAASWWLLFPATYTLVLLHPDDRAALPKHPENPQPRTPGQSEAACADANYCLHLEQVGWLPLDRNGLLLSATAVPRDWSQRLDADPDVAGELRPDPVPNIGRVIRSQVSVSLFQRDGAHQYRSCGGPTTVALRRGVVTLCRLPACS